MRQLRDRVADRSSDGRRQHGFACLKTSEGESHVRGEIRDRNTCGAHVVDTLRYQAKVLPSYGKPLAGGQGDGTTKWECVKKSRAGPGTAFAINVIFGRPKKPTRAPHSRIPHP